MPRLYLLIFTLLPAILLRSGFAIALFGCEKVSSKNATQQASIPNSRSCEPDKLAHDGDTVTVLCDGEKVKVRLCGIDAPELKQPLGINSRDKLRSLLASSKNRISLIEIEKDRYKRTVGEVFLNDERSIQEELLKAGMAYFYAQYADNCPNRDAFIKAEEIARSQKIGVWSGNYQKPWEYRRKNK
jgi:micrococcal nuclease